MKPPNVSIILPTYNGSRYLRRSIDSCLSQTFKDIELVIVDDCSTDSTTAIIQSYRDPRIRYHRNDVNQRLPKSLNIGFSLARGEYLTWTSDDNFYLPEAIEKMVKYLRENKGDFVYTDIFALQEDDIPGAVPVRLPDGDQVSNGNCVRACFLYTRKVMETVGAYDPDMELIEDYDYWVRVSKHFYLHHIKELLYYYRFHPQTLWSKTINESPIRSFLFKFKYDFMPMDIVNWNLRNLKRKKHSGWNAFRQALIGRLFYKRKINEILGRYKSGEWTFAKTRRVLDDLING